MTVKGQKLGKKAMQCRKDGCTKRSKGPRFGWRCEDHQVPGVGWGKRTHGRVTVRKAS